MVNLDADNSTVDWTEDATDYPSFASFITREMQNENTFLWCIAKSVVGRARQGLAGRIAVHRTASFAPVVTMSVGFTGAGGRGLQSTVEAHGL